jgi:hypothetical protein
MFKTRYQNLRKHIGGNVQKIKAKHSKHTLYANHIFVGVAEVFFTFYLETKIIRIVDIPRSALSNDLGLKRNVRYIVSNNVRDRFSNEPLKNCLILFLTNLPKYMAVFTFSNRRSMMYTSIDVTPFNECF